MSKSLTYNFRVMIIENQKEANHELSTIGCDVEGIKIMRDKYTFYTIKIKDLSPTQVNIIKQEILSLGGEAATARGAIDHSIKKSDTIISGTLKQIESLINKLSSHKYFDLSKIGQAIKEALRNFLAEPTLFKARNLSINLKKRTYIMGILNVTPDSFYDGNKYYDYENAIKRADELISLGADIIDIGGESSRPRAKLVSEKEEIQRILPVVKYLAKKKKCLISIDTQKSKVAEKALIAGAHIINDISALNFDSKMAKTIARYNAGVILMHMQGSPKTMQNNPLYKDLIFEVISYLKKSIEIAEKTGILSDQIIVDPGFGFGKTITHNLTLLKKLKELKILGYPILAGTSRKSMIGNILNLPVDKRLMGTAATVVLAILNGANIIRVHDVEEMREVAKTTDLIVRV
ncbi:dihydropteroate synthase [candidate division WOR-1 bacterium RIFOXYA2_FULL_36_21]|uniref:Dihydropteroate synthase n=1 Tax=candidate division WOR-1 bacterium RIFOXYB2_FULL_36_35 TaxID=1802578 RepID=A0A1F4S491_UNCSA|nr:MAG: dihydropteroate synthase [candidate division WOR-1 bacterium RIFOXYA2_FULL_36_21]OGC14250.1 MAG: dihydropteroate synthase [candidate division WOR-1 bacterium RIFOXYA12_FULL_36_13]OGC15255.1 MAG: dihydropteroate synthase [candidate division WOR-1 bacterium RIFOXYB2_FULL_36_35]